MLGLPFTSQQCLNFAAQLLITGARLFEKYGPVAGLAFQRGMIKLLDLPPPFSIHRYSRPFISSSNHTLASFQSR